MKWISFNDKTPKKYEGILLSDGKCISIGMFLGEKFGFSFAEGVAFELNSCFHFDEENSLIGTEITHWMPLPEVPDDD